MPLRRPRKDRGPEPTVSAVPHGTAPPATTSTQMHMSMPSSEVDYRLKEMDEALRKVESDNTLLRKIIVETRSPPGQVYDDNFYQNQLLRIKENMESIVDYLYSKSEWRDPLCRRDVEELVSLLTEFSPRWQEWSSLALIDELAADVNLRVAFARHILTLLLWGPVFMPICFGAKPALNACVEGIMRSARSHGSSKID